MNGSGNKDFIGAELNDTGSGLGSFVLRVAIKTVLVFLVIFSLAATLVGCLFPKLYMNMYRSLGFYGKASVYATAAVERAAGTHDDGCDGSCEYSALLTDGISLASITYGEDASATRLRRLYDFTDAFLALDCHEKRSALTDAKYLKEYGARGLAQLSVLYGYDDYVCGERFRADLLLRGANAYAQLDAPLKAEITAGNAEVLDMLVVYFDHDPQKSGTETGDEFLPYAYFFDAGRYSLLLNTYFGYTDVAEKLATDTLAQKAQKASLLLKLWGLAETLDKAENVFAVATQNVGEGDREYELALLVRKDFFNANETERARSLYIASINGKAAA